MNNDNIEKKASYHIDILGEGVNISQEVSREVAKRVVSLVFDADKIDRAGLGQIVTTAQGGMADTETVDPKAFRASKKPGSDMERITCLAYYLTHFRSTTQYRTKDLTSLNIEAAQPNFANATVAAKNAVQNNYLSIAGGGKRQITSQGEAIVEALPNRDAVKKALEEYKFHKKRSKRNSRKEDEIKSIDEE